MDTARPRRITRSACNRNDYSTLKETMATIKDLELERDTLQAQIAAIDLDNLQGQFDRAKNDRDSFVSPAGSGTLTVHPTETALVLAAGEADRALQDGKYRLRDLTRQLQPLASMLSAPARVQGAQDDLAVLETRKAFATTAIADADRTVQALKALLADAQGIYATERENAAKAVLSDVKAGKDTRVKTPDRGRTAALESALGLAESELADAQEAHALVEAECNEAMAALAEARQDAARLTMEIEIRNFVRSVAEFQQVAGPFDFDNLAERVAICEASDAVG